MRRAHHRARGSNPEMPSGGDRNDWNTRRPARWPRSARALWISDVHIASIASRAAMMPEGRGTRARSRRHANAG
jgi:hypothetical protein